MALSRNSGSQAGWALITGGVTNARVELHRLHQALGKALRLVETSVARDHLYQVAGDLILDIPRRLERVEGLLDETAYALSIMGEDHLKNRLPLGARTKVEETIEGIPAFGGAVLRSSAQQVLQQHLAKQVAASFLRRR